MKKTVFSMAAAAMIIAGCGTQNSTLSQVGSAVLGSVLNQTVGTDVATTTDAIGNVLSSVLGGSSTLKKSQLVGSYTYSQPGCAFTSEKLLAQAGGEIVASEVKTKLEPTFQKIGIKSSNTNVTFSENGTFNAKIAGKSWSGNYTFDEASQKITMQGLLLNMNCYAKRTASGIALLFESSKLLTLLQTMSALSGNSSLQTVGDIAGNYNGLRLGFEFK